MKKLFYLTAAIGFVMASCTKPEPTEESTYSFSIGAEKEAGNTDETRVEFIDGLMHWSVGDNVEIHILNAGAFGTPMDKITEGIPMTGLHREPVRATTFAGKLTYSTISKLNPNNLYDYVTTYSGGAYSLEAYYAGSSTNSRDFYFLYCIPTIFITPKNQFNPQNVFMLAHTFNVPPTTWLENRIQKFGERITFTYKHVFAYLRVKIEENLSGKAIEQIQVTSTSAHNNLTYAALSGHFQYNIDRNSGAVRSLGYTSINGLSGRVTADCNIDGGINSGDYIYIPIPEKTIINSPYSGITGLQFRFLFKYNDYVTKTIDLTTNEIKTLEAGKIYDISFRL